MSPVLLTRKNLTHTGPCATGERLLKGVGPMEPQMDPVYTATCCTVGCSWEQECPTEYQALIASRRHEEEKEFHITVVMSPGFYRQAAA